MKANKKKVLPTTAEDLKLIKELTERSLDERLKAGEVEIVEDFDWSDVPELSEEKEVRLPEKLYRKLQRASRKRKTTPDRLAAEWLSERLGSPAKKA